MKLPWRRWRLPDRGRAALSPETVAAIRTACDRAVAAYRFELELAVRLGDRGPLVERGAYERLIVPPALRLVAALRPVPDAEVHAQVLQLVVSLFASLVESDMARLRTAGEVAW